MEHLTLVDPELLGRPARDLSPELLALGVEVHADLET